MQRITEQLIEEIKDRIVSAVQPEKIISFEPMHKRIFRIRKLLRDFRVPKDVIVYTPQEVNDWKDVSNAFITSIMRKGKVIYGL